MIYFMDFNVDGGCRGNGQPGAIGAAACCLRTSDEYRYATRTHRLPREPAPTSARAELTAIILALEWAYERWEELTFAGRLVGLDVTIKSDSQYAVNCMNLWIYTWQRNSWRNSRGDEVANRDLIERAHYLRTSLRTKGWVKFVWISRNENVLADELCDKVLDAQEHLQRMIV
ncbi:hypothetical protein diail_2864 [Diaporthe ilicicola]|nr:hypothetical protein diail_2864 [Diaporthe ilicicola]